MKFEILELSRNVNDTEGEKKKKKISNFREKRFRIFNSMHSNMILVLFSNLSFHFRPSE